MTATLDRAENLLAAGRVAEGIALLEPESRLHPDNSEIWSCLGRAYGLARRPAEAEGAFRAAVRLRPDLHEAHYNLGLSLAYQNKLRESVGHFVSARRIKPGIHDFQQTLFPILVTLMQQGEQDPAPRATLPPLAERPLVSVVIPTFNRPRMLRDALVSVCRQTYGNWEAIVINDGGCDVSSVLDAMPREAEAKIRRTGLATSRGPAAARNLAIAAAKGDVLAFLDDDDLHAPGHLECLVSTLRASGAGVAYTAAEIVEETVREGVRRETARNRFLPGLRYSRPLLLVRNYIPINTWGVRRECLDAVGTFDESLRYLEDWDLLLRLCGRTAFHQANEVTAEYRVTERSDDSVSKRESHAQAVKSLYQRHDARGVEWVELARELYLETLG